jgi:hypothetical protein
MRFSMMKLLKFGHPNIYKCFILVGDNYMQDRDVIIFFLGGGRAYF